MEQLFTLDNLVTLGMLILLQAVLGFDNLLYISLESKRAPLHQQAAVRRWGIGIAVALRIILLFVLIKAVDTFTNPIFDLHFPGVIEGVFNFHAIIVLVGGAFIIYTATKEILHMMEMEGLDQQEKSKKSMISVIFWIVSMNLVFSFDSILSVMALSDVFIIMAISIITGGALMIWLSDKVSEFLQKNRMYEVMGLFILFVVGIMLLTEGGHLSHLKLFGESIQPMTKTTFYFVIAVLVLSDIVQSRYQKKLMMLKEIRNKILN